MSDSFTRVEEAINNCAQRTATYPRHEILLTKLYCHVYNRLTDYLNRPLKEHGLNATLFSALMQIYASPDNRISPSDLSDAIFSSRTNVTRLADELVKNGWVTRHASQEDRRKMILSLTPTGRTLIDRVLPQQRIIVKQLWVELDAADRDAIERLLRVLLTRLDRSLSSGTEHNHTHTDV